VVLNAAAGLVVTGLAADLTGGADRAEASLDSGRAAASLQAWRAFS
jgi:anthranilate phosphoribosyltransferase